MKLNTIKGYFNASKQSKKILKERKLYFRPGKYRFSARHKKIYYLKNSNTEKFLSSLEKGYDFKKEEKVLFRLKEAMRILFLGLFSVNLNHTLNEFNGQIGMITIRGSTKIFDLEGKKVLTFFKENHEYQRIKIAYFNLSKYYNTTFIEFDDEKLYYSEHLIDFKPLNVWGEKEKEIVFDSIYNANKLYFNECSKVHYEKMSVSKKINEWQTKENLKKTIENYKLLLQEVNLEIPVLTLHGDIHLNNILLSENKVYFIDFEFSGEYFFFFDIFGLICQEPFCNSLSGERSYLISYIHGEYDFKLQELFKILNFNYEPELKKEYFILCCLDWAAQNNRSEEKTIKILNLYDEIETNYKLLVSKNS